MSRVIFGMGWIQVVMVSMSDKITGRAFDAAQRGEGYAIAGCVMLIGIGLHVFRRGQP